MMYYLGLSRMNREEVVAMTAQLKTLNGLNVVGDSVRKAASHAKSSLLGGLSNLLERQGKNSAAAQLRQDQTRHRRPQRSRRRIAEAFERCPGPPDGFR